MNERQKGLAEHESVLVQFKDRRGVADEKFGATLPGPGAGKKGAARRTPARRSVTGRGRPPLGGLRDSTGSGSAATPVDTSAMPRRRGTPRASGGGVPVTSATPPPGIPDRS